MSSPKYLAVKLHHLGVTEDYATSVVGLCSGKDFSLKAYCTDDNDRNGFSDFAGTTMLCSVVDKKLKEIHNNANHAEANYYLFEFSSTITDDAISKAIGVISEAMSFTLNNEKCYVGGLVEPVNVSHTENVLLHEYELYI